MDPISDMFIRVKNAQGARHDAVNIPFSKFKHEILKALERAGRIGTIERKGKRVKRFLEIGLLYNKDNGPLVRDVRLLSKPSRRTYVSVKDIPLSRHGGVVIITTSKGVMTRDEARKSGIGGQVLAEVW